MAITSTDLQSRLSGGASNSDPTAALGGVISSTVLVDATPGNLFPEVDEDLRVSMSFSCFHQEASQIIFW